MILGFRGETGVGRFGTARECNGVFRVAFGGLELVGVFGLGVIAEAGRYSGEARMGVRMRVGVPSSKRCEAGMRDACTVCACRPHMFVAWTDVDFRFIIDERRRGGRIDCDVSEGRLLC